MKKNPRRPVRRRYRGRVHVRHRLRPGEARRRRSSSRAQAAMGGVKFPHAMHSKMEGVHVRRPAIMRRSPRSPSKAAARGRARTATPRRRWPPMKTTPRPRSTSPMAKSGLCIDCHVKEARRARRRRPPSARVPQEGKRLVWSGPGALRAPPPLPPRRPSLARPRTRTFARSTPDQIADTIVQLGTASKLRRGGRTGRRDDSMVKTDQRLLALAARRGGAALSASAQVGDVETRSWPTPGTRSAATRSSTR